MTSPLKPLDEIEDEILKRDLAEYDGGRGYSEPDAFREGAKWGIAKGRELERQRMVELIREFTAGDIALHAENEHYGNNEIDGVDCFVDGARYYCEQLLKKLGLK